MEDHRQISTGRGGAGNMASTPGAAAGAGGAGGAIVASRTPADLVTPTIKSDIYTTGRGGSGNMVANDDPVIARKAQDVEVDVEVVGEGKGMGKGVEGGERVILGRGGAANIYDTSTGADNK
ncbi:hypothetical protein GX51_03016 [Blastomyces parvus]|uniref:Uncharacterized protein n=1 Tax=Blastomyces parvus TaxID=2060905 RepID=A0A2B7X8K5_9EURO|nr:hypothetical protein GX51_03016 [Blastomyces parvus]